jgi:hypothetical protein
MPSDQPAGNQIPASYPVIAYAGVSPPPMIAIFWCRLFALWMLIY